MKNLIGTKLRQRSDYILLACTVGLVVFGVVMVYSASCYAAAKAYGDAFYYVKKQLIGLALGLVAMIAVSRISYKFISKLRYVLLAVSLILLVVVFIPGIGVENYGAKRWIQLPGFTIQASEIAKFGFIVFTASYMAKHYDKLTKFRGLLPVLAVGGTFCVLIILEPNMSITICMVLLMLAMLWIGGARVKHFVILGIPLVALVPILILLEPYRLARLMAFLNPWESPQGEGFQLIQSFYGLGSGGWFGLGLFQSRQKYKFLPFAESDFIFSIIAEELGLVGSVMVIAVYVLLVVRCVKVALRAPDRLGCYLASGVAAIIAIQVAVNIAVVTGSIPPTGLPLPLISSGSSSIIVTLAALGVVQSVARAGSAMPKESQVLAPAQSQHTPRVKHLLGRDGSEPLRPVRARKKRIPKLK